MITETSHFQHPRANDYPHTRVEDLLRELDAPMRLAQRRNDSAEIPFGLFQELNSLLVGWLYVFDEHDKPHVHFYTSTLSVMLSNLRHPSTVQRVDLWMAERTSSGSWDDFARLARDVTYRTGPRQPTIPLGLRIVGRDWFMKRSKPKPESASYDRWKYYEIPRVPFGAGLLDALLGAAI